MSSENPNSRLREIGKFFLDVLRVVIFLILWLKITSLILILKFVFIDNRSEIVLCVVHYAHYAV